MSAELPIAAQPVPPSGPLLGHLARRMHARSELALEPFGLRPRHLIALVVLRDHAEVTQQALSELLMLDSANVVGILNELEREDLILRRRLPSDRRRHVVELTPAGRDRLAQAEFALAAGEAEVLSALSDAQRVQLAELLSLATRGIELDCRAAVTDC